MSGSFYYIDGSGTKCAVDGQTVAQHSDGCWYDQEGHLCHPDGYVDGTSGNDLIDVNYAGDPQGDMVDHGDAILPGMTGNDDYVRAGAGNDTVYANLGNDIVHGGSGNDVLFGGQGNDTLSGDRGNDVLDGGSGHDLLSGGDGRDLFIVDNPTDGIGDTVHGGAGCDDHDTLDLRSAGPVNLVNVRTDSDGNGIDGTVQYLDEHGDVTGTMDFENIEVVKTCPPPPPPCFTPGTLIATPKGERPVEELQPGDKVITRDNGIQEIRWIGHKRLTGKELALDRHLRPILIQKGALGDGLPERDMTVSPNHRMLVANDRTALYFDEHEVLVAAKHLVNHRGIHQISAVAVTYSHFMFDRHEVVLSNGTWTESFQPGDYTLKGMGNAQRNELYELFPDLKTLQGIEGYTSARKTLKKHEARILVR